jgi:peptide/nickel transport system substrate-binding protein
VKDSALFAGSLIRSESSADPLTHLGNAKKKANLGACLTGDPPEPVLPKRQRFWGIAHWEEPKVFHWKAAATALAMAAMTITGGAAQEGASTLVLGQFIAPATFDAPGAEWGNRSLYFQAVYDTLLNVTAEGTVEPFLASEYSYSEDNKTLTLKIRDDVTFIDGTKLTADIVKQNLERFKNGGGPFAVDLVNVESIEAPDATTVILKLSAPDPALVLYLSHEAGIVASPAMFGAADAATNPIGSGPYILDTAASVNGSSYVYKKNPNYWNPDVQHYDNLKINILADPTAIVNAIQASEVNAIKLTGNTTNDVIEAAGWSMNFNELDFMGLLLFDRGGQQNPALADVRVRQAINYAMDREGLLQAMQQGNGTVTTQVFKPSSPAYDPALDQMYPYDPEKAKQLLAEAGFANGLTLSMPSTAVLGAASFTLIQQLLGDVGITVEYVDTPAENYIADQLAPKYPAVFMALQEDTDWQLIQFMLSRTASFNPFKYGDDTTDALIKEIQSGDPATQAAKAKELNKYIVEQAWFAPFFRVRIGYPSDPNTSVTVMPSNAVPSLYDIKPKT